MADGIVDLTAIITRGVESKDLDYKAATSWDGSDKKARCELVKDILALANTAGGWLVIGVSERDSGFSWDGVTEQQAKSFDTTHVNQFVNNYADPPINTTIHKHKYDGKLFVLIQVPPFTDTPHICQKDFGDAKNSGDALISPTLYVRTDNNESAPLKSSADFRAIIERGIRNRSDHMLTQFRTILTHGIQPPEPTDVAKFEEQIQEAREIYHENDPDQGKGYAYRETVFFPTDFQKERYDLQDLRAMLENASVDFRGRPFLFIDRKKEDYVKVVEDGLEMLRLRPPSSGGGDAHYFWGFRQNGLLYAKEILWEDTHRSGSGGDDYYVDFAYCSLRAAETIHCLVKLYEDRIDDTQEVTLRFGLLGVNGRHLGSNDRYLSSSEAERFPDRVSGYFCRIPDVKFEAAHPLIEWRSGLIDHALEICDYIFQRFNWEHPNLAESRKLMEKMFARTL